jgi:hypothetical protein
VSSATPSVLLRRAPEANEHLREHPEANEVFVTGTFDDWGKTERLDRKGDFFEKDVQLPNKDKILYKVRQARASLMPILDCCIWSSSRARHWERVVKNTMGSLILVCRAHRRFDASLNHDAPMENCTPRVGRNWNSLSTIFT